MKKLILPTLISLVLSSPGVLAEETSTSETEANLPAEEATSEAASPAAEETTSPAEQSQPAETASQDLMDKWTAHRKSMQEQLKKLHETDDPEERRRLWEEMQKSRQEMREMMMESSRTPGPGWGGPGPGWGGPGPGWGGPSPGWGGPGPGWGGPGPGWGGPGPGWGGPRWGRGFHNRPFDRMPSDLGDRPGWAKPPVPLQERLENIENLLKQIVDSLPKKDHDDDDD